MPGCFHRGIYSTADVPVLFWRSDTNEETALKCIGKRRTGLLMIDEGQDEFFDVGPNRDLEFKLGQQSRVYRMWDRRPTPARGHGIFEQSRNDGLEGELPVGQNPRGCLPLEEIAVGVSREKCISSLFGAALPVEDLIEVLTVLVISFGAPSGDDPLNTIVIQPDGCPPLTETDLLKSEIPTAGNGAAGSAVMGLRLEGVAALEENRMPQGGEGLDVVPPFLADGAMLKSVLPPI